MGKSKAYKYAYKVKQTYQGCTLQLFGRDTLLTNQQLEEMRQDANKNGCHIQEIALVVQKTGELKRSSAWVTGNIASSQFR